MYENAVYTRSELLRVYILLLCVAWQLIRYRLLPFRCRHWQCIWKLFMSKTIRLELKSVQNIRGTHREWCWCTTYTIIRRKRSYSSMNVIPQWNRYRYVHRTVQVVLNSSVQYTPIGGTNVVHISLLLINAVFMWPNALPMMSYTVFNETPVSFFPINWMHSATPATTTSKQNSEWQMWYGTSGDSIEIKFKEKNMSKIIINYFV